MPAIRYADGKHGEQSRRQMKIHALSWLALPALLAACSGDSERVDARIDPDADANIIERDASGLCWGQVVEPARIETRTVQFLVSPGLNGQPARYQTETHQVIVEPRRAERFEAVCPEDLTESLVLNLQRALSARDIFRGEITGDGDAETVEALRRYQSSRGGPDSDILSRKAAVDLGLIAARPEEVEELL